MAAGSQPEQPQGLSGRDQSTTERLKGYLENHPCSSNNAEALSTVLKRLGDGDDIMFMDKPEQYKQLHTLTSNIKLEPVDRWFLQVYSLSSAFPIYAAYLGPISNLNSIIALVDQWRISRIDGNSVPDISWILALNSVSLFFGCFANISLFLTFSGRVTYDKAQTISICGWYIGFVLLTAAIIASDIVYFSVGSDYEYSEGFWNAVSTAVLYFLCASLLLLNQLGHSKGLYAEAFNLSSHQRRMMVQNVFLLIWLGAGGAVFSKTLPVTYPNGVYYCMVSVLTIGLGDVVSSHNLSRALTIPYAFVGVVSLCLIVSSIRSAILETGNLVNSVHKIERERKLYQKAVSQRDQDPNISVKAFDKLRDIHANAKASGSMQRVYTTIVVFAIFWLLGALAFNQIEGWSYFDAVYFCSLCLLTVGYGDFAPKAPGGRAFFIVWAILSVPMMTILISSLGDTIFEVILQGGDVVTAWLLSAYSVRKTYKDMWNKRWRVLVGRQSLRDILEEEEAAINNETQIIDGDEELVYENADSGDSQASYHKYTPLSNRKFKDAEEEYTVRLLLLMKKMREFARDLGSDPNKKYSFEEWSEILELCGSNEHTRDVDFWLSEKSPLRFPIVEPRFLTALTTHALEKLVLEGLINRNTNQ